MKTLEHYTSEGSSEVLVVLKDVSREAPGRSVLQQAPAPGEMNYCKNSPTCLQMEFGEVQSQKLVSQAALAQSLRQEPEPSQVSWCRATEMAETQGRRLLKELLCFMGLKRKDI